MAKLPKGIRIVAASAKKPASIVVRGYIGSKLDKNWNVTNTEDAVLEALADIKDGDEIRLHVNSKGGDFFTALGTYNALAKRKNVVGENGGYALSSGSLILSAAGRVICPKASATMIHCASAISYAPENAEEKRKTAETLDVMDEAMAAAYAKKMGMSEEEVLKLMRVTTWWTGSQAVAAHFADDDDDVKEPDGDDDDYDAQEEISVVAFYPNIPDTLRARLVASPAKGGKPGAPATPTPTKPKMEKFIKALAAKGIVLPATATEDEVLAAYEKMLSDNQTEIKRAKDAQQKRVEARVTAAVESKKIKAERKQTWIERGMADESALEELDEIPAPQAAAPAPAPAPAPRAPRGNPPLPADPVAEPGDVDAQINACLDRINDLTRQSKRLTAGDPKKSAIAREIGQITAQLGKLRNEVMEHKVTYHPVVSR